MSYFLPYFTYSVGLFLGIQVGKQQNINYRYFLNKNDKVITEYYKNYQMNIRYNK